MEKRIILFLVLSMAVIVLYPYLLEKMGVAKRPVSAAPAAVKKKDVDTDRKSTRLNSSHIQKSRMPSSA